VVHPGAVASRHPLHRLRAAAVPVGDPGASGRRGAAGGPGAAAGAQGGGRAMSFDPNDLYGVLPALILSVGALLLLTSEVFLRGAPRGGGCVSPPAGCSCGARRPPGGGGPTRTAATRPG